MYFSIKYRLYSTNTITLGPISQARTRTKDKYRVVYTDTQRLELEKEFAYNKYITIQ